MSIASVPSGFSTVYSVYRDVPTSPLATRVITEIRGSYAVSIRTTKHGMAGGGGGGGGGGVYIGFLWKHPPRHAAKFEGESNKET